MLEQYLKDLHKAASHGDAREETYYPVIKTFLELFAQEKTKRKAEVTVLPKKTEEVEHLATLFPIKLSYT
jgi:hypothetical protein